jgi:hypothetical protein
MSTLAAFSGFLRGNEVGIVLGSPARKIIMDDVPRHLAFDPRVSFVWRPFFGVIEGTDPTPIDSPDTIRAQHSVTKDRANG